MCSTISTPFGESLPISSSPPQGELPPPPLRDFPQWEVPCDRRRSCRPNPPASMPFPPPAIDQHPPADVPPLPARPPTRSRGPRGPQPGVFFFLFSLLLGCRIKKPQEIILKFLVLDCFRIIDAARRAKPHPFFDQFWFDYSPVLFSL